MAQAGQLTLARTVRTRDFIGSLAQNAAATANVQVPGNVKGPAKHRLKSIVVISAENLAWELQFFASANFKQPGNIDNDLFLGYYLFATNNAVQWSGAGYFYYYIAGLDIPIEDADNTGALHIALVNRSAAAKTAGALGEMVIVLGLEPTLGW